MFQRHSILMFYKTHIRKYSVFHLPCTISSMLKILILINFNILIYSNELINEKSANEPLMNQSGPQEKHNEAIVEITRAIGDCTRMAKVGDLLTVHYNGTFSNGTTVEKDSSHNRNQSLQFQLGFGEVIPGWEKGLLGMCVGEIRRLTVPPHMGYGSNPIGNVPVQSISTFDIELLDIKEGNKSKNIFQQVDTDGNKKLTKDEVAAYFKREAARLNLNVTEWDISDMVWEVFEVDDRNKDGFITRREFSGPVRGPTDEL